jgi:hypothetical protein
LERLVPRGCSTSLINLMDRVFFSNLVVSVGRSRTGTNYMGLKTQISTEAEPQIYDGRQKSCLSLISAVYIISAP